eukprot:g5725.t1
MENEAHNRSSLGRRILSGTVRGRTIKSTLASIFALVGVLASWETMGEVVQNVQEGYERPFFIAYLLHSTYLVFLPVIPLRMYFSRVKGFLPWSVSMRDLIFATVLNIFLVTSDFIWYLSLRKTYVSLNNAIYQSIGVMVYILSILLLGEKPTLKKNMAILFTTAGIVTVAMTSSDDGSGVKSEPIGYALVVLSVLLFSLYEVLYKKFEENCGEASLGNQSNAASFLWEEARASVSRSIAEGMNVVQSEADAPWETSTDGVQYYLDEDENAVDEEQFDENGYDDIISGAEIPKGVNDVLEALTIVSLMGLSNALFLWPGVFVEGFVYPPTTAVTVKIALNSVLGAVYTGSFLVGVQLTSPLFMSLGLVLIVPVGIVVDYILHGTVLRVASGCGALLILVGFFLLTFKCACKRPKKNGKKDDALFDDVDDLVRTTSSWRMPRTPRATGVSVIEN